MRNDVGVIIWESSGGLQRAWGAAVWPVPFSSERKFPGPWMPAQQSFWGRVEGRSLANGFSNRLPGGEEARCWALGLPHCFPEQ